MSALDIDPVCRQRVQPQRLARNGQLVSAQLQGDMAALVNQLARHRTKEYFRSPGDVTTPASDKLWRFAGHVGPLAGTIVARVLMAPQPLGSSQTANPYVQLTLTDATIGSPTFGSVLGTGRAHFGYSYGLTPTEVPKEWGVATIAIDATTFRDTSFRAVLQANDAARPISCTVYESAARPDTDNGYVNSQYSVGAPILDEDRKSIQDLAHALYKRGGGPLFTFSSQTDASAPTQFNGVTRNVVDNVALNAKTATNPAGYLPDLRFCSRKTVATVPVRVECYAGMSGAGTGNVIVRDSAGNVHVNFVVTGPAAWQTPIEADLPADDRVYYVAHAGSGLDTITTYCLSAYRYMA